MRGERGFTLVEVLMTASILTTVLIAISNLFILSMKLNSGAGDLTECVALAQERMERLKNVSYDALAAGGDLQTPESGFHEYVDVDSNGKNDYLVTWQVTDDSPIADLKELRVRALTLKGANAQLGSSKRATFTTYRARGGSL